MSRACQRPLLLLLLGGATLLLLLGMGAGRAEAKGVVLCKVNKDPCPAESIYKGRELYGGVEPSFTGTEIKITLTGVLTTQCTSGKLVTKFSEFIVEPRLGETWIYSFFNCSEKCEVTAENLSYNTTLQATGGGNGSLGVGKVELRVKCGASYDCLYSKGPLPVEVEGGEPPMLRTEQTLSFKSGSGICPSTAAYKAVYRDTAFGPAYVSHN